MSSENNEVKIPLIWRLRAWWHGYDLDDIRARLSKSTEPLSGDISPPAEETPEEKYPDSPPKRDDERDDEDDEIEFIEENHVAVKAVWDTERAHVAQIFWGDGFCGPGGPENIIHMTEPLNVNSKRRTMVIGAGLGGPVRVIHKEYTAPVDGYESSEKLATAGMSMSLEAGIAQDAPIIHIDLENNPAFSRKYDRAFAKESLFIIPDKPRLVQAIHDQLKKDGLFLLTDYIITETADRDSEPFRKWCDLEPYAPKPVTSEAMLACLEEAGFTLKLEEDITDFYLGLIADARKHAKKIIAGMESDEVKNVTILTYMYNEAVFWDTRARLLRNGDLKVIKYLCSRP